MAVRGRRHPNPPSDAVWNQVWNQIGAAILILSFTLAIWIALATAPATAATGRVLKVGVYNFAPLIFIGDDGQAGGLYPDVLAIIASERGWILEYVSGTWADCFERLKRGDIDLLPVIGYTDERAKLFDFTNEYLFLDWGVIYQPKGGGIQSILDLEGKTYAALKSSVYTEQFKNTLRHFNIKANIVELAEYKDVLESVDDRKVDAGIITKIYGILLEPSYSSIEQTNIIFSPLKMLFATRKDRNGDIVDILDEEIAKIKADRGSYYYGLVNKWIGIYRGDGRFPGWLLWSAAAAAGLLMATAAFNLVLQQTVGERTRRLTAANLGLSALADALKESEDRFRIIASAIEQSPSAVAITDDDGAVDYANASFVALTESDAKAVGRPVSAVLFAWDSVSSSARTEFEAAVVQKSPWSGEFPRETRAGAVVWNRVKLIPLTGGDGTPIRLSVVVEDITLSQRYKDELVRQAHHDALTGLPNRFLALDRLKQAIRGAQRDNHRVGTVFLDLDQFKRINDTLGHPIGDQLIVATAERLGRVLRECDTVARLGGDEFLIILPGIRNAIDVETVVEKLYDVLELPLQLGELRLHTSASCGIAVYPEDGASPDDLLRCADAAMYEAKRGGRRCWRYYSSELQTAAERRFTLETELREALARGEFRCVYQPMLRLSDHAPVAVEVLLRWQSASLGEVTPSEFIPIAEDTGLIVELGAWVLRQACQDLACLTAAAGQELILCVNVSALQLESPNFLATVDQAILSAGVSPHLLEIELTERVLINGRREIAEVLSGLRARGIGIAIDDFGTGYSALSYLSRFPVTTLKIDRSFISNLVSNARDAALVTAIISLADTLMLKVIAEGVENIAQLQFLSATACALAQGYWFARPAEVESTMATMRRLSQTAATAAPGCPAARDHSERHVVDYPPTGTGSF